MTPILRMRLVACALAALAAGSVTAAHQIGAQTAGDQQTLALTGCLERTPAAGRGDPAATPASADLAPMFRLTNAQVVEPPGVAKTAAPPAPAKTSMIVAVSAKDDVNLAAHAGARVEVSGTVSRAQWTDWLTHSVKESMTSGTGGRGGAAAPPAGASPPTQATGRSTGSATGGAVPAPGLRPADASPTVLVTAVTRAAGSCDSR